MSESCAGSDGVLASVHLKTARKVCPSHVSDQMESSHLYIWRLLGEYVRVMCRIRWSPHIYASEDCLMCYILVMCCIRWIPHLCACEDCLESMSEPCAGSGGVITSVHLKAAHWVKSESCAGSDGVLTSMHVKTARRVSDSCAGSDGVLTSVHLKSGRWVRSEP
jgi:hypothetical protein